MKAKQGDVVRLKSGGPIMTVGIRVGDLNYCDYYDEEKKTFNTN